MSRSEVYRTLCGKCGARRTDQQMGLEQVPDCFAWARGEPGACGACWVCRMTLVFREVRRVLRDDGTLWVNVAGSYCNAPGNGRGLSWKTGGTPTFQRAGSGNTLGCGWKQKDYVNTPALLAESLRADGWYLRAEIALTKVAPMPESCRDRPTRATEKLYLFAKQARYFYDADADRLPHTAEPQRRYVDGMGAYKDGVPGQAPHGGGTGTSDVPTTYGNPAGRNLWDYWDDTDDDLPPAVWPWRPEGAVKGKKHYATFPLWLPLRVVRLATSARGVCAACGSPWRRVVERKTVRALADEAGTWDERPAAADRPGRGQAVDSTSGLSASNSHDASTPQAPHVRTLGWQPSCRCYGVDLLPSPPRPDADPESVAAWLALRDRLLPLYEPLPAAPARVLDCFAGTGTVGVAARLLGRTFTGIDLSPAYVSKARARLATCCPLDDAILSAAPRAVPPQQSLFPEEPPP